MLHFHTSRPGVGLGSLCRLDQVSLASRTGLMWLSGKVALACWTGFQLLHAEVRLFPRGRLPFLLSALALVFFLEVALAGLVRFPVSTVRTSPCLFPGRTDCEYPGMYCTRWKKDKTRYRKVMSAGEARSRTIGRRKGSSTISLGRDFEAFRPECDRLWRTQYW
jgi:hypothetical protein